MTAAVRFDAAVHKGDELILISQNSVLAYLDLNFALIFCGLCIISNSIMNGGKLLVKLDWERTPLEVCWRDIPSCVLKVK